MNPVSGYQNTLSSHQHPKPFDGLVGSAHVETRSMTDTESSKYRWNQCLRIGAGIGDSGTADERHGGRAGVLAVC